MKVGRCLGIRSLGVYFLSSNIFLIFYPIFRWHLPVILSSWAACSGVIGMNKNKLKLSHHRLYNFYDSSYYTASILETSFIDYFLFWTPLLRRVISLQLGFRCFVGLWVFPIQTTIFGLEYQFLVSIIDVYFYLFANLFSKLFKGVLHLVLILFIAFIVYVPNYCFCIPRFNHN